MLVDVISFVLGLIQYGKALKVRVWSLYSFIFYEIDVKYSHKQPVYS